MIENSTARNSARAAEPGDELNVHYTLKLEDGSVIDKTDSDCPLSFVLGDGTFPSGVEPIFFGMRPGDSDIRTVSPEQGWGYPDSKNIQYLQAADFPDAEMLDPGKVIAFELPNQESLPGTVLAVEDDRVQVDFNPPLAGHTVTVEVTVLSVNEAGNAE